MLLKDKIIRERENTNRIYLYKEGIFWKMYNCSAYYFTTLLKVYVIKKKQLKNLGEEMVCIGFPDSALSGILKTAEDAGMEVMKSGDTIALAIREMPPDYLDWFKQIPVETGEGKKGNAEKRESGENTEKERILHDLLEFQIVRRSPLECQMFLMELQECLRLLIRT